MQVLLLLPLCCELLSKKPALTRGHQPRCFPFLMDCLPSQAIDSGMLRLRLLACSGTYPMVGWVNAHAYYAGIRRWTLPARLEILSLYPTLVNLGFGFPSLRISRLAV